MTRGLGGTVVRPEADCLCGFEATSEWRLYTVARVLQGHHEEGGGPDGFGFGGQSKSMRTSSLRHSRSIRRCVRRRRRVSHQVFAMHRRVRVLVP